MTNASTQTARGFGALPSEWRLVKLKHLATKIGSGKTPRGGNEVYADSGVLFLRSQNVYDDGLRLDDVVFIDEDTDAEMAQTRVRPQDVLLNITGASIGRTAIVPDDLPSANVNQHVCIIRLGAKAQPRFVSYALKSQLVKDQIRSYENGSSREGLNFEQVGNLLVALPAEQGRQRQTADYLDRRTAQIDSLIAKKQQIIAILQEERQAVISHGVTRGLDSAATTKSSDIPWVGEVPSHWRVVQLKRLAQIQTGVTLGKAYSEPTRPYPYLRVANVQDGSFDLDEITEISVPASEAARCQLKSGDVLMTEGGDLDKLGRGSVWKGQIANCLHQNHVFAVRPVAGRLVPEFLAYLTMASHGREYFTLTGQRTTNLASTNTSKVGAFPVPLPPLPEQQAICAYLDRATSRIDEMVRKNTNQIAHLREYRQAVITAAVTGQIEPRPREES